MDTSKHLSKKFIQTSLWALLMIPALVMAQKPYDRIVIFGTSFSDPGNGFFMLNSLTNSDTEQPCTGTSLSVPPYDTLDSFIVPEAPYAKGGHHFSNGATWAELLARYLKKPGNGRPALKKGVSAASNYAVGGARTSHYDCRFNLPDQLAAFKAEAIPTSADTLFVLEFGGNDIRDALSSSDPAALLTNAIQNIGNAVVDLYSHHNARQILIANVPWVNETPAIQKLNQQFPSLNVSFWAHFFTEQFNLGLKGLQSSLNASLPGIDVKILEQDALLTEILEDPAKFGIKNTEDTCVTPKVAPFKCKKPNTYLFWDGIHPTKVVHREIAKRAYQTLGF